MIPTTISFTNTANSAENTLKTYTKTFIINQEVPGSIPGRVQFSENLRKISKLVKKANFEMLSYVLFVSCATKNLTKIQGNKIYPSKITEEMVRTF